MTLSLASTGVATLGWRGGAVSQIFVNSLTYPAFQKFPQKAVTLRIRVLQRSPNANTTEFTLNLQILNHRSIDRPARSSIHVKPSMPSPLAQMNRQYYSYIFQTLFQRTIYLSSYYCNKPKFTSRVQEQNELQHITHL